MRSRYMNVTDGRTDDILLHNRVLRSIARCILVTITVTARCYAERGYATVCRLSVCPSVCMSVRPWRSGAV